MPVHAKERQTQTNVSCKAATAKAVFSLSFSSSFSILVVRFLILFDPRVPPHTYFHVSSDDSVGVFVLNLDDIQTLSRVSWFSPNTDPNAKIDRREKEDLSLDDIRQSSIKAGTNRSDRKSRNRKAIAKNERDTAQTQTKTQQTELQTTATRHCHNQQTR